MTCGCRLKRTPRELGWQGVLHVPLLPKPVIDVPFRQLPGLLHQDTRIEELHCAAQNISIHRDVYDVEGGPFSLLGWKHVQQLVPTASPLQQGM